MYLKEKEIYTIQIDTNLVTMTPNNKNLFYPVRIKDKRGHILNKQLYLPLEEMLDFKLKKEKSNEVRFWKLHRNL